MQKLEYDPEVKILKIRFLRGKSVDSDIIGNLVLDYDKKGHLVKVDIMDVNLEDFIGIADHKKKKTIA
ncbi:hypothetical protein CO046_02650 [Candidatus Peregrinibacteria bacterium CG_4_9_14_0_2_um_filter_53_11]|nr:MAG: hypothetical protein CO046_02650 [Candidatus Peregrinibacteria bacterium CG_4_9_14_0_2_um_filter_53_11]